MLLNSNLYSTFIVSLHYFFQILFVITPFIVSGCNSPYKDVSYKSPAKSRPPTIKKITVAHIVKIVGEVYGSRVSAANQKQGIPLQEKLALCTLLMMLKSGKAKEVQLGKVRLLLVLLTRPGYVD